jgi:ribosomal protein S18 acetylase RimI-like enzyme
MPDLGLGMLRDSMNDLPLHPLPDGHTVRPFEDGDARAWVDLQHAANAHLMAITMATFVKNFGDDLAEMGDRSCFVVSPKGEDVGSITAWWDDGPGGRRGLIHWVAVQPECQAGGIGKAMMTMAMKRLAKEYDTAYLRTSSTRIPAIKLYLDFGFLPDMDADGAKEACAHVRSQLAHAALGNGEQSVIKNRC